MKPTKESIELSGQLHKLGVNKEPEEGDWVSIIGTDAVFVVSTSNIDSIGVFAHIIIPALEWCLEWLREEGVSFSLHPRSIGDKWAKKSGWICGIHYSEDENFINAHGHINSSSFRIATLKAMVSVLEEK